MLGSHQELLLDMTFENILNKITTVPIHTFSIVHDSEELISD